MSYFREVVHTKEMKVSFFKRFFLLGGVLLVASLFSALTPVASAAFAATTGTHSASRASTLTHTAPSRLAPDVCPPSCANPINMCPPLQEEGNSNTWVKVIKFRLNRLDGAGLDATDSIFSPKTKDAVVAFQNKNGITDGGGAVGDRTWSAMGFCRGFEHLFITFPTTRTQCPPDQSNGSSSNNMVFVLAIQALLNIDFDNVLFPNTPDNFHPFLAFDGQFGPNTKAAVIDFQNAVGISGGGGVVGQRTWSALGMCF